MKSVFSLYVTTSSLAYFWRGVLCAGVFALAGGLAEAKPKKDERSGGTYGVARFDVNENGVLDPEEIQALRAAFAAGDTALKALDTNNNGKLDDSEIAVIRLPSASKGKK